MSGSSPGHGLDVHFIEAASDDGASVLLLEVIRGPVEQDVHGPPLAQGLSAHILHGYLLEAHARGHMMPLVAAQDFAALIGVDREQKAQLAEGQLREGQTLFVVAPGVILRRSHGVDGDKFNHGRNNLRFISWAISPWSKIPASRMLSTRRL